MGFDVVFGHSRRLSLTLSVQFAHKNHEIKTHGHSGPWPAVLPATSPVTLAETSTPAANPAEIGPRVLVMKLTHSISLLSGVSNLQKTIAKPPQRPTIALYQERPTQTNSIGNAPTVNNIIGIRILSSFSIWDGVQNNFRIRGIRG